MDLPHSMSDERGNTLVETVIVLPLGMAVLLGIFTGGSAYFEKISLVDAARDGARYGASLKVPDAGPAAWKQAVRERVAALADGEVEASDVCAELIVPTGSDTTCGVRDPVGAAGDPSTDAPVSIVKVSVAKPTTLEFIFFTSRPTLSAKIAARYERDVE